MSLPEQLATIPYLLRAQICNLFESVILLFLGLWLTSLPHGHAQNAHEPVAELTSLKVAKGFQVNLFAAEPMVVKPIQMQFDPQGRLWVLCTTAYPQIKPGEKPKDRLVILEDTDGDGQADKSTDFARDLVIPTGLALGHGGAYIGHGTELIHLRDTDGDGKADQRRVILSGFGTGDSHQNINSFTWSPGGELLFCQGHNIYSRIETFAGVKSLDRAGVWRFRPGTLELESFFHESSGPLNPWGVVFDGWGQPFLADGCCIGLFYLLPVMVPNKPVEKYSPLWLGKKVCGVDILSGGHYPAEEQGDIVGGTFFNNSVSRWRITEDGSGFAAKELPPLIESTNRNFRIVDVKVGPDGAIYLADWYNPIIGHYQYSFRHPDRDQTHGRIWRMTKKDRPLVPHPNLSDQSPESLLEQLKAPENYTRNQARRVLGEIDPAKLVPALRQWMPKLDPADPQREHHLLEALMVFETRDLIELDLLKQLLHARDHRARAYATRVLGRWHARVGTALDLLAVQAGDPHPRVRLEAVVALNSIPSAQAMDVALKVADQPMDRFLEYALRQAVQGLKPYWGPDFAARSLALQNHQKRLEFLIKADGSHETLQPLVKLIQSETLNSETRAGFLEILAKAGGPEELTLLLDPKLSTNSDGYNAGLHARMLTALAATEKLRKVRPTGDLVVALATMVDQPNEALCAEAMKLAGVWKLETLRSRLEQVAESGEKSLTLRQAAMDGIASLGGDKSREVLLRLASAALSEGVRFAAVSRLAAVDFKQAADQAAGLLASGSIETDPTELFSAFLQRTGGAEALAQSLRRKPPATDAAKLGLRLMRSVGRQDTTLVEVLETASGLQNEFKPLSSEETTALSAEVREKGDRNRGEAIFRRADLSCLACHSVEKQGGHIGPDLNSIGTGQPVDFIIGAILSPNKEIKEGYSAFEVTTKSGETYQGYKIRESNGELVLRDVLQNQELHLRLDAIRAQRALGSLMPAGLVNHLTRAEFRDLLRYLSELGTPVR